MQTKKRTITKDTNTTKPAMRKASTEVDPQRAMRQYLTWHEAENHSRKTQTNYSKTLPTFFAYLKSEHQLTDLNAVTIDHLRLWLVWLRNTPGQYGKKRSSQTIDTYCTQMMAFLRWCHVESIIDADPTERLKSPKVEKKHIRVFSDDEVKRMHEAAVPPTNGLRPDVRRMLTARNRAVLWVLLDTGMRASEMCGMRFMDIDRKRGTVYIMGKGAKERKVLLGQRGYHYLTAYLDYWRGEPESNEDRLIVSDDGSVFTNQGVCRLFAKIKQRAGITDKRVSAHTCRHWYAIRFLLKGGKLFALQRHLGHESLEMVRIYANMTDQDAEDEKRKYSPADDVEIESKVQRKRGFRQG